MDKSSKRMSIWKHLIGSTGSLFAGLCCLGFAPALSLLTAIGDLVSSKELIKRGPLVLNFCRGGWCPYCNLELKAYQEKLPEIKKTWSTINSNFTQLAG
ncbi:MAG: redoxin domain-containing protein [Thermodesulfobacteriota bacterium]